MPGLKNSITSFVFIVVSIFASGAQQPNVVIKERLNQDNSLTLSAGVTGYGKFTVDISYVRLENTISDAQIRVIIDKETKDFISLLPQDPTLPVSAEYRYDWLQGAIDSGADTEFVYRLPFSEGISSLPQRFFGSMPMSREIRDYTVWEFPFDKSGPVYAMRKGLVINKVSDNITPANNKITIEHTDGSVADYSCLAPGSLRVNEGETVTPDTVIAETGATEGGYAVMVGVYYYVSNSDPIFGGIAKKQYFNPVFATKKGNAHMENATGVTASASKKMLNKEEPKKGFWQRLFGRK